MRDLKIEEFANHVFGLLHSRVAKLDDFAAIYANNVIMLFETIGFFKLCEIFTKLMFFN